MNVVELQLIKESWKNIMRKKQLKMAHQENVRVVLAFLADTIQTYTAQSAQS